MSKILYAFLFVLMQTSVSFAQYITLDADKEVIWDSKAQKMTAVGNAVAKKQDMSIRADKMEAYYAKNDTTKKSTITEVHAQGNIVLTSENANAYGLTLDYNIAQDAVVLKGEPARLKTPKEEITAKESITYYPQAQKAIALGNVKAKDKENNQIFSEKMIAFFSKDAQNKMVMDKVEIYNNIKIITKDATVTADKGLYLPKIGVIKLFDNVLIDQQGNKLRGDFAETNINTGKSRIIAGSTSKGRVSGVFKEKKKD